MTFPVDMAMKLGAAAGSGIRANSESGAGQAVGSVLDPLGNLSQAFAEGNFAEGIPVVGGFLRANRMKEEKEKLEKQEKIQRLKDMNNYSQSVFSSIPTNGIEGASFGMGGKMKYDMGGFMELQGPKHEQGGIPLGSVEVEGGETIKNNFVFSDRINPTDAFKNALSMNGITGGKTYADVSKKIERKRKKLNNMEEGRKYSDSTKSAMNEKLDFLVEGLAQDQEASKMFEEGKKMGYGGKIKKMQHGGPHPDPDPNNPWHRMLGIGIGQGGEFGGAGATGVYGPGAAFRGAGATGDFNGAGMGLNIPPADNPVMAPGVMPVQAAKRDPQGINFGAVFSNKSPETQVGFSGRPYVGPSVEPRKGLIKGVTEDYPSGAPEAPSYRPPTNILPGVTVTAKRPGKGGKAAPKPIPKLAPPPEPGLITDAVLPGAAGTENVPAITPEQAQTVDTTVMRNTAPLTTGAKIGNFLNDNMGNLLAGIQTGVNQGIINKMETNRDPNLARYPIYNYVDRSAQALRQNDDSLRAVLNTFDGDVQSRNTNRAAALAQKLKADSQVRNQERGREDAFRADFNSRLGQVDQFNAQIKNATEEGNLTRRNQQRGLTQQNISNLTRSIIGNEVQGDLKKRDAMAMALIAARDGDRGTVQRLIQQFPDLLEMIKQFT